MGALDWLQVVASHWAKQEFALLDRVPTGISDWKWTSYQCQSDTIYYIYISQIYIYIHTYIYIVHTVHVVKLEYKWTDQRNPSDSAMAPERSLSSMSMKVFLTMNPRSWMSPNGQGTWIERWNKKLWNALTISMIQNSAKRKRLPKNWNAAELDFIGDVTFVLVLGNTSSTFVQSATSFCGSYKMDWRQHITLMYIII